MSHCVLWQLCAVACKLVAISVSMLSVVYIRLVLGAGVVGPIAAVSGPWYM
jgi:hypothetical protein